jgi:hypothetical protein
MTDAASTNDALERLVAQYEDGVANRESSDAAAWLNARSEIDAQWDSLTDKQIDRVQAADSTLIQNAGQVASRLAAAGGGALRDMRASTPRPPEQWWWYLDVLSHVSDYISPETGQPTKQPSTLFSRILTAIEVIVLIVAIFLLGRNLLPQLSLTPSPSPFPSWTPAPTATLDPQAFDLSSATTFKAQHDVLEVPVPKGWETAPETTPGEYQFSYGQGTSSSASLQVNIGDPKTFYEQIMGVTASVDSPKAALEAFKQNTPADSQFKVGDVRPVKIGKLDGQGVLISIPASAQRAESEVELWIAPLPDNKVVLVIMQNSKSISDRAKPVLLKMTDSMVVNPQNIPTPTPTSTPHPLRLTQTAVEAQIEALTPTVTPTPLATGAATSAATGAATLPATSAATAPAVSTSAK